MSDYETHYGTLRKIDLEGLTLEEKCKELCDQHSVKLNDWGWYTSYTSLLRDRLNDWYVILNGTLYSITDHTIDNDCYCILNENEDGSYNYYARFYNGSTYLEECLEDEFYNI